MCRNTAVILICNILLLSGCFKSEQAKKEDKRQQIIAKINKKEADLEKRLGKHFRKLKSPLSIHIESSSDNVEAGDTFELTAFITSKVQQDDVYIDWKLPAGVDLVSGSMNEFIDSLLPNQPKDFTITVSQAVKENQQVHLLVKSIKHGSGTTAQYNTVLQDKINESAERLYKRNKEYQKSKK